MRTKQDQIIFQCTEIENQCYYNVIIKNVSNQMIKTFFNYIKNVIILTSWWLQDVSKNLFNVSW